MKAALEMRVRGSARVAGLILLATAATAPGQAVSGDATPAAPAGAAAQNAAAGSAQFAQVPPDLIERSGNSLLRAGAAMPQQDSAQNHEGQTRMAQVSFFAVPPPQPKMLKKHDLITIVVREESQAQSTGTTDAKQDTTLNAQLAQYVKLTEQFQLKGVIPTNPLGVQANMDREFKGDATAGRTDSFVTRIGAEVVDVKPNGTLVVQARKHIKLDEEEQDYILSGVCRVEDVGPDNSVLSTQLHDLDLQKMTKGIVHDTNKRGFITKLLDTFNPF